MSGCLSDNVDELKKVNNRNITDLEEECNEIAKSVNLDKDVILRAANQE